MVKLVRGIEILPAPGEPDAFQISVDSEGNYLSTRVGPTLTARGAAIIAAWLCLSRPELESLWSTVISTEQSTT